MRSLLYRRSFAFNGNLNPRVDPAHPMSKKLVCSAVPVTSNNFINLLDGRIGVASSLLPIGGTLVRAYLGPAANFDNTSGAQEVTFPTGIPAPVSPYPATLGGFLMMTALHSNIQCMVYNGKNVHLQLGIFSNTFQLNRWGGSNDNTGFTPVAGAPYFLACTTDNVSTTSFVWTRLDTGRIQSFRVTPGGAAVAGTQVTGMGNAGGNAFDGWIGPVMVSQAVHTFTEMMAWAADPWGFWYPTLRPNPGFDAMMVGLQSGAPPPSGTPRMPLMGVGP